MADKNTIRLINIESYMHGSDRYFGILQVDITPRKGALRGFKDEGQFYVTKKIRFGDSEFPVTLTIRAENLEYVMTLINAANGDVVVKGTGDDGNSYNITITDVEYDTPSFGLQRDQESAFNVVGKATADPLTPNTLPMVIAVAA